MLIKHVHGSTFFLLATSQICFHFSLSLATMRFPRTIFRSRSLHRLPLSSLSFEWESTSCHGVRNLQFLQNYWTRMKNGYSNDTNIKYNLLNIKTPAGLSEKNVCTEGLIQDTTSNKTLRNNRCHHKNKLVHFGATLGSFCSTFTLQKKTAKDWTQPTKKNLFFYFFI